MGENEDGLRIETFGGLSIQHSGRKLSGLASRKAEAMLVYLALEGQAIPRSVLSSLFWEESSESSASTNLRVALSSLKKQLDPFLEIDRQSVRVRSSRPVWLDTLALERHLADDDLEAGLALYQGDFLQGFHMRDARTFEDWQTMTREHYRLRIRDSLHDGVKQCTLRHALKTGLRYSRRLLDLDPFDEVALRRMLELLAWTGQRNAAIQQFERYRKIYAEELGVKPDPVTWDLFNRIRDGIIQPDPSTRMQNETTSLAAAQSGGSNLPQPMTPFIGRKTELESLSDLLSDPEVRLVTILGPGGTGKTRLCQEIGRRQIKRFKDGVFLVPLVSISEPEAMIAAIAQAAGFPTDEKGEQFKQLLDYLEHRNMLMLLDNFDSVLAGAPAVAGILQRAPGLKAITTSREKLNLTGEHVFRLSGLDFERSEGAPDEAVRDSDLLFLQTARRLNPEIPADQAARAQIAEICRLVEGLPLAIELAASWTDTLTLAEIRAQIESGLDILEAALGDLPQRHQNIRMVFDGTIQSLDLPTQQCFSALSVFRGSFNARAAQEIAGASIHQLKTLVRKSLLPLHEAGRYQLHELLRQYGAEKLAETPGREARIKTLHSEYYRDVLVRVEKQLIGGRIAGRERPVYAAEIRNFRGGFRWAVESGDIETVLAFVPGLSTLDPAGSLIALFDWAIGKLGKDNPTVETEIAIGHLRCVSGFTKFFNGLQAEGRAEIRGGRTILADAGAAASARLHTANLAATNTFALGFDFDYFPLIQAALDDFRQDYRIRSVLRVAGTYFRNRGDPDHAEAYFQELIDLAEPLYERSWLAESRLGLGLLAEDQNRYPEAIDQMHKSLLLYAELGFQQMVGVLHKHLGLLYAALNQFSTAFDHFRRQLELFKKIGVQWRMVEGYMSLGETRLLMGSLEEAQRYYALALQSFREVEDSSPIGAYLAGELGWLATVEQDYGHALARFLPAFHANQQVYPDHMIPSFMSRAIPLLEAFDKTALAEKAAAFVVSGRVYVQLNNRRPATRLMEKIKAEQGVDAHDALVMQAGQIKQARLQAEFEETLIAIGEKIGI